MSDAVAPSHPEVAAAFNTRVAFLLELARRLHQYGTTAPRLEMAVTLSARRLGLQADVWSSPTAIIISFADLAQGDGEAAQLTQVMRLAPGDINLARLCKADQIADQVIAGEIGLRGGFRLLRALGTPDGRLAKLNTIASYGLSAASIAALFLHSSWVDLLVAGVIGMLIGAITLLAATRRRLAVASDAISAMVATAVTIGVSAFVVPLAIKSVVLASLIILVPGFSLTTAIREIAAGHLVSGMARLGGATATMFKLVFGVLAASAVCAAFGIHARGFTLPALPAWTDWPSLLVAAVAFAMLFRAAWRDWPAVIVAVIAGYLATRWGGEFSGRLPSAPFGVFVGGLLVSALANLYARVAKQPGAVIREPGILLLVPGSVGFRSMSFLLERDTTLGVDSAMLLLTVLMALVGGLLFGEMLVSPRRSL